MIHREIVIGASECCADDSTQADTRGLFSLLPEQTSVAVAVSDYAQAVAAHLDAESESDPQWWGDFAETFGFDPQELANATTGALLRAEICVEGSWEEVVVARIDSQKAQPLLDAYRPKQEQASEAQVSREHIILATTKAAAQAIVKRLEDAGDPVLLTGWKQLSLEDNRDSTDALTLTWYASPWLKEQWHLDQDYDAKLSQKLRDAQRHGLTGIESLGGVVTYDNGLPVAARTTAYAPRPWSATLKMFEHLQPEKDLRLPAWVPDDIDHVEVASLNLPLAFQHIDALFDDFYAAGIEGTYRETLQDIRNELKVDLEKDLYADMGRQICLLHTGTEDAALRRTLYAFETKSPETAGAAIRRLMEDDPGVKEVAIEGHTEPMWHVPAEEPGGEDFVFMVTNKYILFSNDAKLMHRVLKPDAAHTLAQDEEVQQTITAILASVEDAPCFFAVRGQANSARTTKKDRHRPPFELLFAGPKRLDMWSEEQSGDFLSTILPNGEDFRVSVGFSAENGWQVHSQTLPHHGEEGTNNSHE